MLIPSKKLRELQDKAKSLEKQMDDIINADGKISDWQALRDELSIVQNIKIPCEMNRINPIIVDGHDLPTRKAPQYV